MKQDTMSIAKQACKKISLLQDTKSTANFSKLHTILLAMAENILRIELDPVLNINKALTTELKVINVKYERAMYEQNQAYYLLLRHVDPEAFNRAAEPKPPACLCKA